MKILDAIVSGIAHILHPDKPRLIGENIHLPTDFTADEVIASLNAAAKGTPLEGWYERRSIVDLIKLTHPENSDEASSKPKRAQLASDLGNNNYSGMIDENEWLFAQTIKAIQQRGIPLPSE